MKKHIHILGICGTFMASIAVLAKQMGYKVTGSDTNIYPPMSTFLHEENIEIWDGYLPEHLQPAPDLVIVGNAIGRGNSAIEYMLNNNLPYTSGPEWFSTNFLQNKWVIAVAGTHGKTTTTSMLAHILDYAGLEPGFLIGGIPQDFNVSARVGNSKYFVIEADEYDSAFFDKRSKFIHYKPRTLVLNNLEYDHADLFPSVTAIQRQFHHLIRTIPANGMIVHNNAYPHLTEAIAMGCWTPCQSFALASDKTMTTPTWHAEFIKPDGSHFAIFHKDQCVGELNWEYLGKHNMQNALAATIAAYDVGIDPKTAIKALSKFKGVKRRLELKGCVNNIRVYDDFSHHPTEIESTLYGIHKKVKETGRVFAVVEPRTRSMRMGTHAEQLSSSLQYASQIIIFEPADLDWDIACAMQDSEQPVAIYNSVEHIINHLVTHTRPDDHIIIMSNGGFGNIHERLLQALA